MIYIIHPAGTHRTIHTNHFASMAEKFFPSNQIKFITDKQFLVKDITEYNSNDAFLIRLGADTVLKCLNILSMLQSKGHTIFPNYHSIKKCLDKGSFYELCKLNNLPIPKSVTFTRESEYKKWHYSEFGNYCVIKPTIGSLGSGIHIVHHSKVAEKLEYLFKHDHEYYGHCDAVVQSYITNKLNKPQSLRMFVLNGKFTVSISITNDIIDFQVSNLNKGGVTAPYFPDDELIELAEKICKVTGIEFTALDFVQDKQGKYYCLESNIAPHLSRAYLLHHGRVNHPEMIFKHILDMSNKGSIML